MSPLRSKQQPNSDPVMDEITNHSETYHTSSFVASGRLEIRVRASRDDISLVDEMSNVICHLCELMYKRCNLVYISKDSLLLFMICSLVILC